MALKPALRPPLRPPMHGVNAPREGVGGWVVAGNRIEYPRRRSTLSAGFKMFTDRWHRSPPVPISSLKALFHAGYMATGGTGLAALGNDLTIACAVMFPAGTAPGVNQAFSVGGVHEFTVADGTWVEAELAIDLPASSVYRLRTWVTGASGFTPYGMPGMGQSAGHLANFPTGATDRGAYSAIQADETQSAVNVAAVVNSDSLYEPILLGFTGAARPTTWGLVGDSLMKGGLDVGTGTGGSVPANSGDGWGNAGWWPRAIAAKGDQYLNLAVPAATIEDFISAQALFDKAAPVCKKVIVGLGTNSLGAAAANLTKLQTLVDRARVFASDVVISTLPPRTTDGTNTTNHASTTLYNDMNTAIRAGQITGARVVDLRAIVQDSGDNNKWRSDGGAWTGDGTHPSIYGIGQTATALAALL